MKGNIGPYKIVMHLDPSVSNGECCGYYYYTDTKHYKHVITYS